MESILIKAFSFILIIIIGYILKKMKFFGKEDYKIVSKIVMNVTLPCALITGFSSFEMDGSMLLIVLIGFLCNIITASIGFIVAINKDNKEKAFNMLNLSGYNIGCFTLPYIQSFLGATGVGIASLFDTGNSIMCTGGTYALASTVSGNGEKQSLSEFFKKIFLSVPFDTYLFMLIVTITRIKLPNFIYDITGNLSAGNAFLSMLMIGMVFECKLKREHLTKVFSIIGMRYLLATIFAVMSYYFLPFSIEVRQVLVILVFAPISVLTPIFTGMCGADQGLAGVVNSISIPISIIIITSLLFILGIC